MFNKDLGLVYSRRLFVQCPRGRAFPPTETMVNVHLPAKATDVIKALNLVPHPEGCLFVETWRSGAQPMRSRGQTDFDVKPGALVETDRGSRRDDDDGRRNWMTSVFYMITSAVPIEGLSYALSEAVYYFHGGAPVQYVVVPADGTSVFHVTLGPDICNGHRLQVGVPCRAWTGGRLLDDGVHDYALIGKALSPGFDYHDFSHVSWETAQAEHPEIAHDLKPFILSPEGSFEEYYNNDDKRNTRLLLRTPGGAI